MTKISRLRRLLVRVLLLTIMAEGTAYAISPNPIGAAVMIACIGAFTAAVVSSWIARQSCDHTHLMRGPVSTRCADCSELVSVDKKAVQTMADAINSKPWQLPEEQPLSGPSEGVTRALGGGPNAPYVGLFEFDFFVPLAVCPACGLEAWHDMRPPYPDEGHDSTTKTQKYWKVDHAMRDYEVIRTCSAKNCQVNWGQNPSTGFPPPMLGPFAPTEAEAMMMRRPVTANLPELRARGAVIEVDGIRIPDIADARAKTTLADREVYKRANGKYEVVAGGFVVASKDPRSGTWSVPMTPTRFMDEDGNVAPTTPENEKWANNIVKAQGDQTLDLTAGAPQGWLESTEARYGGHEIGSTEQPPVEDDDSYITAEVVDPRADDLIVLGHHVDREFGMTDPQYADKAPSFDYVDQLAEWSAEPKYFDPDSPSSDRTEYDDEL